MEPDSAGALPAPGVAPVRWGVPDALVAWFVGLGVSLVAAGPFIDPNRPSDRQVGALLVLLVAQSIGIVGWLAIVARRKGRGSLAADFGLALHLRDLRWLAAGVGVSLVADWMLLPITELARLKHSSQDVVKAFNHASGIEVPLFALSVVAIAPVAEELLFRGVLLRALVRRFTPAVAVFVSALVFALVHVVGDPGTGYYLPAFLLLGLVSGWRALRTGSISQSILLHAGFNLLAAVLIVS